MQISVLTLNAWGVPLVASLRKERMNAIGVALNSCGFDVICLQEVWCKADFNIIKSHCSNTYKYWHNCYSGLSGSGLCIFSKYPIKESLYYQFPLNGYFHAIHHADWIAGKGVMLVKLIVNNEFLNVYVTHLHAQYNKPHETDKYVTHRIIQAFDTALFIRMTSQSADFCILAGDLNTEPNDICTKLIIFIAGLKDSHDYHNAHDILLSTDGHDACSSFTNDTLFNTFRDGSLPSEFKGRRIDYIMYKEKSNFRVKEIIYKVCPLGFQVPKNSFSFSDHEAVGATFYLIKDSEKSSMTDGLDARDAGDESLHDAWHVCKDQMKRDLQATQRYKFYMLSLFLIMLCSSQFLSPLLLILVWLVGTLVLVFMLILIVTEYQDYSWMKNATKRMKLLIVKRKQFSDPLGLDH